MKKANVLIFGDDGLLGAALKLANVEYINDVRMRDVRDEAYGYDSPAAGEIDSWRADRPLAVIAVCGGAVPVGRLLPSLKRPVDFLAICTPELPDEYGPDIQLGYVTHAGPALLIIENAAELTVNADDYVIDQCLQYQSQSANIIIGSGDLSDTRPMLERPDSLAKIVQLVLKNIRSICQ